MDDLIQTLDVAIDFSYCAIKEAFANLINIGIVVYIPAHVNDKQYALTFVLQKIKHMRFFNNTNILYPVLQTSKLEYVGIYVTLGGGR